ncbi:hypothetical protein F4X88_02320 [Candidatus Poribacteria bacterium]|nr:hypothetical protein [Candidatus Poribacteria bacterium]MYA55106.1 hypothetical protein [Candidatus Poribacteria bacterium]
MASLRDFFRDLLNWEEQQSDQLGQQWSQELREAVAPVSENTISEAGQQEHELIHQWPQELRNTIVSAFENAVSESSVKGSVCSVSPGASNQKIGNEIEKYTVPKLNSSLLDFSISKCRGSGYPDQILIQDTPRLQMPLEMKATGDWNEKDSNRRVLVSSSKKLRAQFSAPIYHLLLTVLYSKQDDEDFVTINTIRLDFLEPTTAVNVRLEVSVSHKILADGDHYSKTF